jgi:hypothetical protein
MTLADDKRGVLATHQTKLKGQTADYEQKLAPVTEIEQRLEVALGEQAAAEAHYSEMLQREAETIVTCGDTVAANQNVTQAAGDLDQKRRVVAALQAEKASREAALADAALSLNIASSATEGLVAQVVEAVADDVVADLVAAGAAFTKAQAAAKTLAAHITGKGWFAIAERLNVKLNSLKIPSWQASAHPDWAVFTKSLETDATARVQQ